MIHIKVTYKDNHKHTCTLNHLPKYLPKLASSDRSGQYSSWSGQHKFFPVQQPLDNCEIFLYGALILFQWQD